MDNWTLLGSGRAARDDISVDDGCAVACQGKRSRCPSNGL